jgi:hypothetical protein
MADAETLARPEWQRQLQTVRQLQSEKSASLPILNPCPKSEHREAASSLKS